jgi:hypothetical protein
MKIAYITREYPKSYYRNRHKLSWRFANELKCTVFTYFAWIKNKLLFSKIDGFFDTSLLTIDGLYEVNLRDFKKSKQRKDHDAMVVHYRSNSAKLHGDDTTLIEIARNFHGIKALYINDDKAETMKSDDVLNFYDLIFKREPFKDLSNYPISDRNRAKIRPTMLSCPGIHKTRFAHRTATGKRSVQVGSSADAKKYDVFFIGKNTPLRHDTWRSVVDIGCVAIGGLIPRHGHERVPAKLLTKPMPPKEFLYTIHHSKINLAINGHGQFTHRHLEILAEGGFLLTDRSICDLWLPITLQEGVHFAAFSSEIELVEKIEYYLENKSERASIAKAGNEVFRKEYCIKTHGQYLLNCIQDVANKTIAP